MNEIEYRKATSVRGGLMFMKGVEGVAFGDRVQVRDQRGNVRNGQVIRSSDEVLLVQVFEGTDGLDLEHTWVRFLDEPFELALSPDLLGRVFNGIGAPRDGRPELIAKERRSVNGTPINPAARAYPREFIQTGISAIDGLNSLVRGQKLPIFTGSGLPHNRLAAQIARQARLTDEEARFAIIFAAMGVSHEEARFFREDFEQTGVLGNVAMFLNLADDPPIERLILPRTAFTAAEYLAYELGMHILLILTDMINYAEALREVATAKGDVPSRKGYPGYLYSDLADIYERAGRIKHRQGSITHVPVVSMPSDDITHPIPDLTGYITEGQIVLSRNLHSAGVYPPIDAPPSLSRLMKSGIGKAYTREDHQHVANQVYASYAHALNIRNLASIIGREELSEEDRRYLDFAEAFEHRFVGQREDEDRSIGETLEMAWEVLSILPPDELTRVSEEEISSYYKKTPSMQETRQAGAKEKRDEASTGSAETQEDTPASQKEDSS